jgi:hypothetical protein
MRRTSGVQSLGWQINPILSNLIAAKASNPTVEKHVFR